MAKKLYFYYAAMNAGKSTTLLQASYNYVERGMQTLIFAPSFDDRFKRSTVHSRIGLHQKAVGFDHHFNFYTYVQEKISDGADYACILVDEAHFLSKNQVAELSEIATSLDIATLTYGLRTDFQGEPFEGSRYLLAWAEEITEIKTICSCSRKGIMNLRIDEDGNPLSVGSQVHIGGNESYISKCMDCYKMAVPTITNLVRKTTIV